MSNRKLSNSGRIAHRSDLEVLEAIKVLRQRHPGEAITGYRIQKFFGEGHVNTYKSAIERLTVGGSLESEGEHDPALDLILNDAKKLLASIRQAATTGFDDKIQDLQDVHKAEKEQMQATISQLTTDHKQLASELNQLQRLAQSLEKQVQDGRQVADKERARAEELQQENRQLASETDKNAHTIKALEERTQHYEQELAIMGELESEAIQVQKQGYERQLGDLRAEVERLNQEVTTSREVRERVSSEAARTLEAKNQLSKEVHELTLQLKDQEALQSQLDDQTRRAQQLFEQVETARSDANSWKEAVTTLGKAQPNCQLLYSNDTRLVLLDPQGVWVLDSEELIQLSQEELSEALSLPQGFLFPQPHLFLDREQFTRVDESLWHRLIQDTLDE